MANTKSHYTTETPTAQSEVCQPAMKHDISTPLARALEHARRGWPVFPCDPKPHRKHPDRPSKRPLTRNGFYDATCDEEQIRRWWKQYPNALIGIPTGEVSGFDVLDTDNERDAQGALVKDGEGNLKKEMGRRGWSLPDTLCATTSRGGTHRLFRHVPGAISNINLLPNVDVRADGGYIIAPGSIGHVGAAWEWGAGGALNDISDAPDWLASAFRTGRMPGEDGDVPPSRADEATVSADHGDVIGDLDTTDADDIRRALAEHWDSDSYGDWVKAALALHRHAHGRELWEEWASTGSSYDPAEADRKWSQTTPTRGITARSILVRVPKEKLRAWARERSVAEGSSGGDIGNAKAFARRYHGELACLFPDGKYVRWTGSRWALCENGEEVEAAKELAQDIVTEAISRFQNGGGSDADKARLRSATSLRNSASKLRAMLELAKSDPLMAVHQRDFDCDPWLLGVPNGVVDLRTGTLVPPNPDQRIMRQAGVPFDASAQCPRWLRFLEDVQPEPEVRAFLQRAVGYTLTGLTVEEKIFFLWGGGANGKSVFATVLALLMGDYHVTIGASALAKNRNGSNTEADRAIARLPGARLALANETAQGSIWDDQKLKELASRDPIAARKLFSEGFDFMPSHTLWIRGNHLPGAHDAGDGFWRRMIAVPFRVKFPEHSRVPDLDRQLFDTEKTGILAWAVKGCLAWQRQGLGVPSVLLADIAAYRHETDLLGQWIEECLVRDPQGRVTAAEAYQSFGGFCKDQGVTAPSQRQFSTQLAERNIETSKAAKGARVYRGYNCVVSHNTFSDLTTGGGG